MEKICFKLVLNSKNSQNTNGTAMVEVEAKQVSEKIYLPTNVFIKPNQWNINMQEVNSSHPNHELLNRFLQEFVLKLEWKELQMWKNNTPMTLKKLNSSYMEEDNICDGAFIDFCKEYIQSGRKRNSTKKNLMTTVKLLNIFCPDMPYSALTHDFIMRFETFMTEKGYKTNTIIKHIKHLRSFYNEAVGRKLIRCEQDAFCRYKMLKGESKYTFLRPEELRKLENLILKGKSIKMAHTLDAFLFCCYTGLRYSDFCSLSNENLIKIDNNVWLVYKSIKTEVETRLPLYLLFNGKAVTLLKKYQNDISAFFKIKSNSLIDKELKKIKDIAGIDTHISFHTARHTNATLLVYKGVNLTTVQKLLGHKSIKTTQHYADIIPEGIVNDLLRNA